MDKNVEHMHGIECPFQSERARQSGNLLMRFQISPLPKESRKAFSHLDFLTETKKESYPHRPKWEVTALYLLNVQQ